MSGTQAKISSPATGYEPEGERPLAGYTVLTGGFAVAAAGGLLLAKRNRGELPQGFNAWDALTMGAAAHKLSRLITKDRVTSFLRAPFIRYQEPDGHGEVSEEPRGEGLRKAVGELLVCPYCVGQWVAAGLGIGMVGAPRLTRLVTFVYTAETIADFLQLAYVAAEDAAS